jgi:hypothetical protein
MLITDRLINDPTVLELFGDLNDLLREQLEEFTMNLRERKRLRNKVVRELLKKIW